MGKTRARFDNKKGFFNHARERVVASGQESGENDGFVRK